MPSTEGGERCRREQGRQAVEKDQAGWPTSPKFLNFGQILPGSGLTSYGGWGVINVSRRGGGSMIEKNRQLVTNEPVEFEK